MSDDFNMMDIILKRVPPLEIGEFNLDSIILSEESIISEPKEDIGKGIKIRMYVYNAEGSGVPHVHLVSKDFDNGDCCIKLLKSAIYPHKNHQTILNSDQCKKLNKIMSKPYRKNNKITNWQAAIKYWSDNVSNLGSPSQPNYSDAYKHIEPIGR